MYLTLGSLLEFAHVVIAFWFVTGLVARNIALAQMSRVTSIGEVETLAKLSGRFDNLMVIPGSIAVLIAGILTAWEQAWPLLGSLGRGDSDWLLVSILLYLSIFPLVPMVFIPRGKRFNETLQAAVRQGELAPELRASLSDSVVRVAHVYELAAVGLVIFLMVTKPF